MLKNWKLRYTEESEKNDLEYETEIGETEIES